MNEARVSPPSAAEYQFPRHFAVKRGPHYVSAFGTQPTPFASCGRNWCMLAEAETVANNLNESGCSPRWEVVRLEVSDLVIDDLMSIPEGAAFLRVSEAAIRKWFSSRDNPLPRIKCGSRTLVSRHDLLSRLTIRTGGAA